MFPERRGEHCSLPCLSPCEIAQYAYGSSQLQSMWQALRLTESSKYPGTSNLPSRRPTDSSHIQEKKIAATDGVGMLERISSALKMSDLVGVPLNPTLTTVSHTMKRNTRHSLHSILSVTKPLHTTEQDADSKKKKKRKILPR